MPKRVNFDCINGDGKKAIARGMCSACYARWERQTPKGMARIEKRNAMKRGNRAVVRRIKPSTRPDNMVTVYGTGNNGHHMLVCAGAMAVLLEYPRREIMFRALDVNGDGEGIPAMAVVPETSSKKGYAITVRKCGTGQLCCDRSIVAKGRYLMDMEPYHVDGIDWYLLMASDTESSINNHQSTIINQQS